MLWKKGCKRCALGKAAHGPYWYGYQLVTNKRGKQRLKKTYFGSAFKYKRPELNKGDTLERNADISIETLLQRELTAQERAHISRNRPGYGAGRA